ncbi:MAG: polysaccharide biosynthesis/export family protein [Sphingomonadaceae bacterium]
MGLTTMTNRSRRTPLALLAGLFAALVALLPVPAAAQAPANAYVLGPNDLITVVVYGQSEFNVQTRIKPDGSIVMPLIGRVQAQGKTVITLAEEVQRRLESGNFLRNPIVNVEVNEYNSRFVRVAGKVGAPGLVPLERSNRLLDVLLRAGWVRDDGSDTILVRRAGDGKEVRINSADLARGNAQDLALEAGDTVFIDTAEVVFVTGAVNRPGRYPLTPGMTVTELLATAGGVAPTGSANRVGLRRGGAARETDADGQTRLQPGDIINVRERLF